MVFPCLSDMADKRRKIVNCFWNMRNIRKIERDVGNGCLKTWKAKSQSFSLLRYSSYNKWNLWYFKKAVVKHKENLSYLHLLWQLWAEILVLFELECFSQTITITPEITLILFEYKQLPDLRAMSKRILCK